MTAKVTDTTGVTGTPTGTVVFYDGAVLIGSANLVAADPTFANATFSTAVLTAGSHSLAAAYLGDATFALSVSSPALAQVVGPRPATVAIGLSPAAVGVGANSPVNVTVTDAATTGPAGIPGVFAAAPAGLSVARQFHATTALTDGTLVVVGGVDGTPAVLSSVELYNPSVGNFSLGNILNSPRAGHTATLLQDGTVLVVGGTNSGVASGVLATAEIISVAGTSTLLVGPGQNLSTARMGHTATLLSDGRVLIAGGQDSTGAALSSVEVYDPITQTFSAGPGPLNLARSAATATLLPSGRILFAGGDATGTAELYDPVAGTSTGTGNLTVIRSGHSATLLLDGNVLLVGGGVAPASVELYDATAGSFVAVSAVLVAARTGHSAIMLNDGRIAIIAGVNGTDGTLSNAELYTPSFDPMGAVTLTSDDTTDTLVNCSLILNGTGATTCQGTVTPGQVGSGTHAITATYAAGSIHSGNTNSGNITVQAGTQAALAVIVPTSGTYGQTYTLTTTGGSGTGLVTYDVGASDACTVLGDQLTMTLGTGGTCTVTATKAADTNYDAASSPATPVTLAKRDVTVTADAKTKVYGDADPALTYQVTSGTLAFTDAFTGALTRVAGDTVVAPGPTYAIQQDTLALNANYNLTYVGADLTITVRPITVTADAKAKVYGDADPALTYQITSGTLAFTDAFTGAISRVAGETVVAPGPTYAIQRDTLALDGNYNLSFVGANLTITPRAITVTADAKAKVFGDADPALTYQITSGSLLVGDAFTGALSRVAGETVVAPGPAYSIQQGTLVLNANYILSYVGASLTVTARSTTVTLAPSVNPSTFGNSVTFTATVASTAGTPTGTVNFLDGAASLGSATLDGAGLATLSTAALAVGPHSITVAYAGDGNYTGSTSSVTAQLVNPAQSATTTALTASANPAVFGAAVTFTATVSSSGGTPAGSVDFFDGATSLGSGTLDGTGKATLTTAVLGGGSHSVTAVYAGDSLFLTSTSAVMSHVINPAASATTLKSSAAVVHPPATLTLTATVTSGAGTPSGSVTFSAGTKSLGTANLNASGVAVLTVTSPAVTGKLSITAAFAGSANHATSTSAALTQYLFTAAPDYKLEASRTQVTLSRGQSALVGVTLTPINGYDGTITFSCPNLPTGVSCTFDPPQLKGSLDNTAATALLQIRTSGPNASNVMRPPASSGHSPLLAFWTMGLGAVGLLVGGVRTQRRNRRWMWVLGMGLLLVLVLAGCGYSPVASTAQFTPTGSTSATVTASATAMSTGTAAANPSQQLQIQITVLP